MTSEELEELRARVERKKIQEEKARLKNELLGRNSQVDESVVYMSVKEAAKELGIRKETVLRLIADGDLPNSIMAKAGHSRGRAWAIHPRDVENCRTRFRRLFK